MIKTLDTLKMADAIAPQMGISLHDIAVATSESMIAWLELHKTLCEKVTRLGLSDIEVNTLQVLKWFPNTTQLIVYGGDGETRKGLFCGAAIDLSGISHCSNLKELCIMNGTSPVDLSDLKKLKKIHLFAHGVVSKPSMNLVVTLPPSADSSFEEISLSGYFSKIENTE
jgi:hypothetical protein